MTFHAQKAKAPTRELQPGFRKVEPMLERRRALSEAEIRQELSCFFPRKADELMGRFADSRASLMGEFGAYVEIVGLPNGGLKFQCRLEFLTEDRTLDLDLNQAVTGSGFHLALNSVPVTSGARDEQYERRTRIEGLCETVAWFEQRTIRTYIITPTEASSRIDRAAESAEALLRLARMVRPAIPPAPAAEKPAGNVVPIETARASRPPPPKPASAEPLAEEPSALPGGKAS